MACSCTDASSPSPDCEIHFYLRPTTQAKQAYTSAPAKAPVVGFPAGTTKTGQIGWPDHSELELLIETAGARLAWSRATFCPCIDTTSETQQPDPNCTRCGGDGFTYFGPKNYAPPNAVGTLDSIQKAIIGDTLPSGAAVIAGLIQRGTSTRDPYDVLGNWWRGGLYVSVRPVNLLGYYDRIVNLDANIVYYETVAMPATSLNVPIRYRATLVNEIESLTTRYYDGEDFTVDTTGKINFLASKAPAPGTRLSVHYCTHPTWLITEHPHAIRETPSRGNKMDLACDPPTPVGRPRALPIQAKIELEYIPKMPGT